jgi:patatin-like phospholipase
VFRTYDHYPPSPLSSRKSKEKHKNPGNAHSEEIYKIARATSAAPRYFSKMLINDNWYRDGAIGANNPAEIALDEVIQMHEQPPKIVVSLGTGEKNLKTKATENKKTGLITDWRSVAKVLTQIATESARTARTVEEACRKHDINYWRWNAPAPMGDIKLDEWLPRSNGKETRKKIKSQTASYLSRPKVYRRMWECARWLVKQRRDRALTERWEVFARRFVYFCPEPGCQGRSSAFLTRGELRDHGMYEHSYVSACKVQGHDQFKYACVQDRCRAEGIHIYETEADLEEHLRGRVHNMKHPKLRSQRFLEAWLDEGRITHIQAAKRQLSNEVEETETEFEQEVEFDDDDLSFLPSGSDMETRGTAATTPELRGLPSPNKKQTGPQTNEEVEVLELDGEKGTGMILTSHTNGACEISAQ